MVEKDPTSVSQMFNDIAPAYDRLNHLFSFSIDRHWRRKAVALIPKGKKIHVLDVATGTGDLAIAIAKQRDANVIGVDFSEKMLEVGRKKVEQLSKGNVVELRFGDALDLPFEENTFDVCTIGFGVRNFVNLEDGLREMRRVLKPDGMVIILEFSLPENPIVAKIYDLFSRRIIPFFGRIYSRHQSAYNYLPSSIRSFPYGKSFEQIMEKNGFKSVKSKDLSAGIATIYYGTK